MFSWFKTTPKSPGSTLILKVGQMHCVSCALNIDSLLEETPGILSASTSYAKCQTHVNYDAEKINPDKIRQLVYSLGYTII